MLYNNKLKQATIVAFLVPAFVAVDSFIEDVYAHIFFIRSGAVFLLFYNDVCFYLYFNTVLKFWRQTIYFDFHDKGGSGDK